MSDVQNSDSEKRSLNTPSETSYKKDDKPFEELPVEESSSKGFTDFIGVVLLCLMISFGGFVFGFDTGTIGGFFNMGNFKKRFGSYH